MPTLANPLYANGVPTYSNEVGALAGVFQALASNPLRDLQIQGYVNNSRLAKLRGDVIQNKQNMYPQLAEALKPGGRLQDVASIVAGGGDLKALPDAMKAASGMYGFRALEPGGLANVDPAIQATLSGAVGQNVANTMYGFDQNQDRQTQEANQKNDTVMRGQNIRSADSRYGTDVGATTARRGQDIGQQNAIYGDNLRAMYPTGGRGTGVGGTGTSTGKPPAAPQMNTATAKGLSSLFTTDMPPGLPDEAQNDAKQRAIYYVNNGDASTRNNPVAAWVKAKNDVVGDNQPTRKTAWGYGEYGDPTTAPVDPQARPALPEPVANIYGGPATSVSNTAGGVGGGGGGLSPLGQSILQGNPNIDLRQPLSAGQLRPAAPAAPAAAPVAGLAPAPAAAPVGAPAQNDGMITASSPADLAGLPSGTPFKTPDGRVKYVP